MGFLHRTRVIVSRKQPYVDWANGLRREDDVAFPREFVQKRNVYLGPYSEFEQPLDRALQEIWQDVLMTFETERQKRSIQRWCRLAIQLNGAADSGRFDHITPLVVVRELQHDRVFEFLAGELPTTVWEISTLTDVDRHELLRLWKMMSEAYDPTQFHVARNGLALLVAYVLHLIANLHATVPI